MSSRFSNQVAVVFGAGRGIGEAIALRLSREGAKLVVIDILKNEVNELKLKIEENGGEVAAFQIDISDEKKVNQCLDHIVKSNLKQKPRNNEIKQQNVNQLINPNIDEVNEASANTPYSNPSINEIDQLRSINQQLEGESAALRQLLLTEQKSKEKALSALQTKLSGLSNRVDELKRTAQRIQVPPDQVSVSTNIMRSSVDSRTKEKDPQQLIFDQSQASLSESSYFTNQVLIASSLCRLFVCILNV